ncbi:MAG: sulfatase [Bacteroidota bacterium]
MRTSIGILGLLLLLGACTTSAETQSKSEQPNIIIIFADDLGYGDLGTFGHPSIRTPHLDQMAANGIKMTQFYSAASVCTPSRAALMTGRLPIRSGMCSSKRRVLFPDSDGGLPANEITIAEGLKSVGYATACIGKWHLGHKNPYLPTDHGFDEYFGIPYSNDMSPRENDWAGAQHFPSIPLMEGDSLIETRPDQGKLTKRYTEKALDFITRNQSNPFFLYFPHTFPHVPLYANEDFAGKSLRGLYGDVVEEIDWSLGQIIAKLAELGISENTLVVFTSDNGPWLVMKEEGGSAGLLRQGKGSSWEGGQREPFVAQWPGVIAAGQTNAAIASTMDLLPTCFALAGAALPNDRVIDGMDLMPVLKAETETLYQTFPYFLGAELFAYRAGPWKIHFKTLTPYIGEPKLTHDPPLLFHLEHDPSETHDLAADNPEIVKELKLKAMSFLSTLDSVPSQLEKRLP